MFIKNGKSLFGNTGLVISLIILCVLLFLSYKKCYVGSSIENFVCPNLDNPNDPTCSTTPMVTPMATPTPTSNYASPNNVRVAINGGTVTVNFTIDNSQNKKIPINFAVILGQYLLQDDNTKKNTGNNKFILSNETEINSSILVNLTNSNTNMCLLSNGKPACQYIFNNLDVRDPSGNLYYYKVGVSSVYANDEYNSPFITPYNISTLDKMFTLDSSADQQSKSYSDFLAYQKGQQGNISANVYDSTISTADGQYELIKSQLGNYPDNLLLDQQTINQGTLDDLVDKTMAQGILNVDVS